MIPSTGVPRVDRARRRLFVEPVTRALPDPADRPEVEVFRDHGECVFHFPGGKSIGLDLRRITEYAYVRFEVANRGGPCLPFMSDHAWYAVVRALVPGEALQ